MKDFETLSDILKARHSCRAFRPDPVPRAMVEQIVRAAQRAPSWCNAQPWQVIVTDSDETERLRQGLLDGLETAGHNPDIPFPARYSGPYKERRSICGWQLYDAVGVAKGDREASSAQMRENFRFFGAPHVALITSEAELGPYGLVDCGGFITAFTLAAQSLGIATIPQAAVASYAPYLHDWFGLPENRLIVCCIALGYSDTDHAANSFRTDRAMLEQVLSWRGRTAYLGAVRTS